ncbi:MAG: four helix bundle protein [Chloroflexota bacterium]|nr:MAG: four helix bundle protein [Chloroflexota bacterium]
MGRAPSFEEWVAQVPESLKQDPLWDFQVYPKALYFYDLAWEDCEYLLKDPRGRAVAHQLIRSAGSISANIEEGYGRGYGKEYSYFLRVSIGSARETRGWYYRGRRLLPPDVFKHRLSLLDEIIAMLAPNIQRQRQYQRK